MNSDKKLTLSFLRMKRTWVIATTIIILVTLAFVFIQTQHTRSTELSLDDGRPKLLDLGMGVCTQCKRMKPIMAQIQKDMGDDLDVYTLDLRDEKSEQIADQFNMTEIPLIILVNGNGEELWRHNGFVELETLRAAVKKQLKVK